MTGKSNMKSDNGFTVPELLIAMVIGGIVMAAVVQLLITEVRTHNAQFAVSRLQQSTRSAMDYMIRYTRMSGYDPSNMSGANFNATLANRMDFTCDTNQNGLIDIDWDEMVIFRLSGNNLVREDTGGNGQTVARNIEALNFRYLDRNGNDTTAPMDVRSVQITLVGRTSPDSGLMSRFTDTAVYTNQRGDILLPAQNDSARRLLMTAEVKCRNLSM